MVFKKVSYENYTGNQEVTLKVEMLVPVNQVGRIIGKGGQTVSIQFLMSSIWYFGEKKPVSNFFRFYGNWQNYVWPVPKNWPEAGGILLMLQAGASVK